jgi:hypothetical protein
MIEKKFQFPSIKKGDPQNVIVLVGLWMCAATLAIIVILNFSAKRKSPSEVKRTEAEHFEKKHTDHRYSHHTASIYVSGLMVKQNKIAND